MPAVATAGVGKDVKFIKGKARTCAFAHIGVMQGFGLQICNLISDDAVLRTAHTDVDASDNVKPETLTLRNDSPAASKNSCFRDSAELLSTFIF